MEKSGGGGEIKFLAETYFGSSEKKGICVVYCI